MPMQTPKGLGLLMPKADEQPPEDYLETAATDLIAAVKTEDVQGVKDALRAAFMACDNDAGE
jgi:hypothetical protein